MLILQAAHDGYCRLVRGLTHTRTWELGRNRLVIADSLGSPCSGEVIYHFHPNVQVEMLTPRSGRLLLRNGRSLTWECSRPVLVQAGTWHPEFGVAVHNRHLVADMGEGRATFTLDW